VDRYRVAIIGCGNIARNHARAWQSIPERAEIAAIADTDEEALADAGDAWRVAADHAYSDFREMLDRERPDIVSVCTWTGLHAPATIAAAVRRPKVILCEKPMATSLGEADAMLTACRRNGVKLAIGHMRRFYPGWTQARHLIAEGAIGTPVRAWSAVSEGLLNWGTHLIDGVRYVLGDPPAEWVLGAVTRETDRYERGVRIEDALLGLVQFAGSADRPGVPSVQATFQIDLGPTKHWQIIGADGMVEAREGNVRLLDGRNGGWRDLEGSEWGFQDAFNAQMRAIVEWADAGALAVAGGTEARLAAERAAAAGSAAMGGASAASVQAAEYRGDGANARATLEIALAIYESARMQEVTRLPLLTRANPLQLMLDSGQLPTRRPGRYDIRSHLVRGEAMSWE
jgi:predicted dehydrogenase